MFQNVDLLGNFAVLRYEVSQFDGRWCNLYSNLLCVFVSTLVGYDYFAKNAVFNVLKMFIIFVT